MGIREYNGRVGIDIREFVSSEKYTGPTKKGLRIPAEHFQEFKKMIDSISEEDLKQAEPTPEVPEPPKEQTTLSEAPKEELPDY